MMMRFVKNKIYIIGAIVVLTILSLILFFISPLFIEIKNNSKNLFSERNNAAILRVQSDEIENFKKLYDDYKPNLEKINTLFIDPQNPVNFIKFLEDTAYASSIKLQISLSPFAQQKDKSIVVFQISSIGDFIKISHFLEKLENGPYLIEVQNISIRNADTDPVVKDYPSGNVSANFLVNALVAKK